MTYRLRLRAALDLPDPVRRIVPVPDPAEDRRPGDRAELPAVPGPGRPVRVDEDVLRRDLQLLEAARAPGAVGARPSPALDPLPGHPDEVAGDPDDPLEEPPLEVGRVGDDDDVPVGREL